MKAISCQELSWKYSGRKRFAVENVNLDIEENTFVSIVGPNEHGKTTLVSCIKGLIPANYHGIWYGKVEIFGEDNRNITGQKMASEVGYVFADPESQFTSMTVEEELVFGLENIGLPFQVVHDRLEWVSEITLIKELWDKSPYEISGGQKQRVAIASVLAMKPRIMILDEPTSMLDPIGKDSIFDIMTNVKNETKMTIIVVEHNIEQIAPLSDQILLMYEGQIAKMAPPEEFFNNSDFLVDHGILPPQATAFVDRLKQDGFYDGVLPVDYEGGVKATRQVLQRHTA
ncbi:MAG: ATP-binding cassette domain-containing protein [Proteobacteria bacterium]|nr:ATP-binding cassette domain-containing protein [Pseudomonadota bacterium]